MLSSDGFSQSYTSPISWHHSVYEARVSALGHSTAALQNGTAYHLNPAIPLESGVLNVSSFLLSATAFESFAVPDGADLYSPAISFSSGKFSYTAIMEYISFSTNLDDDYSNRQLRFNTGYQINENFSVGAGFLHSSYSYSSDSNITYAGEYRGDATAWGITAGAYYRDQFESGQFNFKPQAGLSINDLSNGFDFENSDSGNGPLPGQVRLGLGLDLSSKITRFNRPLYGAGIYTGFSKYLARNEYDGSTSQINSLSGFEALFTTWNSFERFDGARNVEVTLGEQISTSIGIELHLSETLYLRYGVLGGSDWWIRPQNGLGIELDLYYISLSVSHMNYHSSDEWSPQDNQTYVQTTFRVPVDGQERDTLLDRIFDR